MPIRFNPSKDKIYYVYILRRPDKCDPFDIEKGQPFYIGKGSNGRALQHRIEAESYKTGRKPIKIFVIRHLWKMGLDYEIDMIAQHISENEAFRFEKFLIKKYGRIDKHTGLLANQTDGGEGCSGRIASEKYKQLMSKKFKGIPCSEEKKKKISESLKGNKLSKETCKKLSEIRLGEKNHFYGKNHSDESKQKMREAKLGKDGPWKNKNRPEETKRKISLTQIGRTHSLETRRKRSESLKAFYAKKREERNALPI